MRISGGNDVSKHLAVAIAALSVFTAATVVVACTDGGHDSLAPTGTVAAQTPVPHQDSGAHQESVGGVPPRLACQVNHVAATGTQVVDWRGGVVVFGSNTLVIPPGALDGPVTITATAPAGQALIAQFEPEGLRFDIPAQVVLSYQGCTLPDSMAHIDYINDSHTSVLEMEPSTIQTPQQLIVAPISHFSVYAVAE
jgi:hypothetical protein